MPTSSELRSKATELRRIADKLDAAAEGLEELNGPHLPAQSANKNGVVLVAPANLRRLSGLDAIHRVLTESKGPIRKDDLASNLAHGGKALGEGTLMSYLSRDKRFISLGNAVWDLRSRHNEG